MALVVRSAHAVPLQCAKRAGSPELSRRGIRFLAPIRSKWRMQLARERENCPASKRGSKIPTFQRGRGVLLPIIVLPSELGLLRTAVLLRKVQ